MEAKLYTVGEEIFNSVSHGVGSLFAVIGSTVLVTMAAMKGSVTGAVAFFVYGLSMVILYTMSTLYHAFPMPTVKKIFRIFDHSTIYLLIAGSYTPFTLVLLRDSKSALAVCISVWAAAILGIVLNAIDIKKFTVISMVLYVVMGWAGLFIIVPIYRALGSGFYLLLAGGISYTAGLIFYGLKKIRYMHSIWHLFVLMGTVLHFFCIAFYVLPAA